VNEKFRQLTDHYDIANFYELEPWKDTHDVIVGPTDAQIGVAHETLRPVHGDHITMCQFGDAHDQVFGLLCSGIGKATGIRPAVAPKASSPASSRPATNPEPSKPILRSEDEGFFTEVSSLAKFEPNPIFSAQSSAPGSAMAVSATSATPSFVAASYLPGSERAEKCWGEGEWQFERNRTRVLEERDAPGGEERVMRDTIEVIARRQGPTPTAYPGVSDVPNHGVRYDAEPRSGGMAQAPLMLDKEQDKPVATPWGFGTKLRGYAFRVFGMSS